MTSPQRKAIQPKFYSGSFVTFNPLSLVDVIGVRRETLA